MKVDYKQMQEEGFAKLQEMVEPFMANHPGFGNP